MAAKVVKEEKMDKRWKFMFVVLAYAMLAYVLTVDVSAQQGMLTDALEEVSMTAADEEHP